MSNLLLISGSLEQADMPADAALRSLLFENLKSHPKLALAIDKFREAKSGSSKRTWKWLYQKLEEAIEIDQLDENTGHVEKALQSTGGHKVPANPAKKDAKEDKPKEEKPSKTKEPKPEKKDKSKQEKTSKEVPAAPGKGDGKGKGKKSDAKPANPGNQGGKGGGKPALSKDEKSKQPCMYFAFDACTKGDKCPYLHDKNNMYRGPKPKPLEKTTSAGSATAHAGAARVVSGAIAASSVLSAEGVSSHSAPRSEASDQHGFASTFAKACRTWWKKGRRVAKKGIIKRPLKQFIRCPSLLEKAVKCFAAMTMVCNPVGTCHEFLIDSGAGRNLISQKMMPEFWGQFLADAPENLKFSTGGGVKSCSKALKLRGDTMGEGVFYALKDCPPAISLGQQVIDFRKPWIWLPDELPYFVKPDRVKDIKIVVPEDAKVHATKVVEYVPILEEHVECLAMVGKVDTKPSASSSSSSSKEDPKTVLEKSRPQELGTSSPGAILETPPGREVPLHQKHAHLLNTLDDVKSDDDYAPTTPAETPKDVPEEGGPTKG